MTAEFIYRGIVPHTLSMKEAHAYSLHFEDLIERDYKGRKAAFAEPLGKALETISRMF